MIYEPAVGVGLTIDVIDGIEVILESFVNSNSIALRFSSIIGH